MAHALLLFLVAHQGELILLGLGALMALVASLPPRYAALPVVGFAVRFVDRLSVLVHAQDAGTLKLPGVGSLAFKAALEALQGAPKDGAK